jgi:protease-4
MKRIVVGTLAVIGGLVVGIVVAGVLVNLFFGGSTAIPAKTILEADLEQEVREYNLDDPVIELVREPAMTVRDVVEALQHAAQDDRVVAFVARIGAVEMGLAHTQEIRDAVLAFRQAGKKAVAYAETFGEFGPGNSAYYLASAFDTIYLQPSGDVGFTGLVFESPFLKGTLEKLALTPRLDHRYEYKNFMNIFTERQYTAPHQEANQQVMASQFGQMVRGIAAARHLAETELRQRIDHGPFLGEEAVAAGLVDGLAYRDEVYGQVQEKAGEEARLLFLSQYLARAGRPHRKGTVVALIYGVGPVRRGPSGYDALSNGPAMGADTVTAAFRAAVKDEAVKAILFRVDSPGGSYVASDAIWRETQRAREAGKPVIVSMANVAGSGGYFVAMAADKIVAQPGTITGSIGVLGGKMLTADFWSQLGLSWDEVHTSTNATMWSSTHDYTPEQWARLQAWLDRVYHDFTRKVAAGRHLPIEKVLEVAKGRIWSGEDAKGLGLVDELGGFPVALRLVREALTLPADAALDLQVFPRPVSTFDALMTRLFGEDRESSEIRELTVFLTHLRRLIRPMARLAQSLGLSPRQDVLMMPELRPEN